MLLRFGTVQFGFVWVWAKSRFIFVFPIFPQLFAQAGQLYSKENVVHIPQ